jgi:hypothetical protein
MSNFAQQFQQAEQQKRKYVFQRNPHCFKLTDDALNPSMEQAFTVALQKFFTAKPTGSEKKASNPRTEFYAKYKQEAEHADKDFQKKYEEDLNTTLIFVGLRELVAFT